MKQEEHQEIQESQSSSSLEGLRIKGPFAIVQLHNDDIKSEDSQEATTIIHDDLVKTENDAHDETAKDFSMTDVLSDINDKIDKDQTQDEDFDMFITRKDATENITNPADANESARTPPKCDSANLQWRCKSCDYIYKDNVRLKTHIFENHQKDYPK